MSAGMRRIMVMGPPGSGKSTLARDLGAKLDLPFFHLDQAFHQPGWIAAPPELFRNEVERLARLPAWIIDGNYVDTIAPRLLAADTIIYLDIPAWLSIVRLIRRTLVHYGRVRPDAAPGCPERLTFGFLRFAGTWNRTRRARHLALLDGFDGQKRVLTGPAQQSTFWASL